MIGTILSFSPLFIVLTLPVWGKVEKIIDRRFLIIIAAAMTLTMEYFLVIPKTFTVIAIITIIYSFVRAPLYPSIDSMTTIYCLEKNVEFSTIRGWGSLGYLIAVGIGGLIFDKLGFYYVLIISTIIFMGLFYSTAKINPLVLDNDKKSERKQKGNLKQIIKNPFFVKFIIAQVLTYTALNINTGFDILYLSYRNAPTYIYSLYTMGRIGFEILCFKFIRKTKFSYKTLFAVIPVLLLLQSILYFIEAPIYTIFFLMATTGTAVGIIIYINNKYISQIVRPKNITLATYITALIQNLTIAVFTFLGGIILDNSGAKYIYLATGIFFIAGFIFIIFFIKKTGRYTVMKYYD